MKRDRWDRVADVLGGLGIGMLIGLTVSFIAFGQALSQAIIIWN
jgi:hypothetical protein